MGRYIVTGGAGHIGSHVADALIERGDEVLIVDNLLTGSKSNLNPKAGWLECSVVDAVKDKRLNGKFDGIFHLAAYTNVREGTKNPSLMSESGANLTVAALSIAKNLQIPKFVFVSSVVVEYNPRIPYGIEKEMGERYCNFYGKNFGISSSVIRLHSVYGSPRHNANSGNVVPSFIQQKKSTGKLQISGDGSQIRDFTYYTDAVAAILEAENRPGLTEIGTCNGHSILEVAQFFNCPIEFIGKPPGEVDEQVCRKSDYPTKISFAEGMKRWQN